MVKSLHDCSEGGLAVALAEMSFSSGIGASVVLRQVPYNGKNRRDDYILFSESNSCFFAEISPSVRKEFEKLMRGTPFAVIGCTEGTDVLTVYGLDGEECVDAKIDELKKAWQKTLGW